MAEFPNPKSDECWQVIHDGASRPIIQSPDGRWLSVSQFHKGRWESYEDEESDAAAICAALNAVTTNIDAAPSGSDVDAPVDRELLALLDEVDAYCAEAKGMRHDFDEVSWLPRLSRELRARLGGSK